MVWLVLFFDRQLVGWLVRLKDACCIVHKAMGIASREEGELMASEGLLALSSLALCPF